jgi:phenylalanyl-tRNA synthetase alpha chain
MLMCRFGASQGKLGGAFDVGMKAAARNKWIGFEKGNKDLVLRKVCI